MTILITGGSGFLGQALIKRLLDKGETEIRVISRSEKGLIELREKFDVRIMSGDISDPFTCEKACKGVDRIFHLAAMKHIIMAEENPRECIKSNILGTLNILEQTIKNKPKFIIGISTDKAAKVTGVYGATKLLGERLFAEYEQLNKDTKYRVVRYGNVLYSSGSVLCRWKEKLENGGKIIITDPDATRFYWTVDQAIDLIFECLDNAKDSTPRLTDMKTIRTGDLLKAMIEKYAGGREIAVKEIGLQSGENLHEEIGDNKLSSDKAPKYTKDEILNLI